MSCQVTTAQLALPTVKNDCMWPSMMSVHSLFISDTCASCSHSSGTFVAGWAVRLCMPSCRAGSRDHFLLRSLQLDGHRCHYVL